MPETLRFRPLPIGVRRLTSRPDDIADGQISMETAYWPMHMEKFGDDTFDLSDKATGAFVRFLNFYVKRNGNVPFEEAKLCERLRYKTVRSFRPVWDELVSSGMIAVSRGMVTCSHGDFVLERVRKARQQKVDAGKEGAAARAETIAARNAKNAPEARSPDVRGEYDGNTTAIAIERDGKSEQNQRPNFGSAHQLKTETEKKNPAGNAREASGPAKTMNGHVNGGGLVQEVIEEFYRIAGEIYGKDVMQRERSNHANNAVLAQDWLHQAGGSLQQVSAAMGSALAAWSRTRTCPGMLGAISKSMPSHIDVAGRGATLTAMSSGRSAPSAKVGGKTLWLKVFEQAIENGHGEIASHLVALAGDEAPGEVEAANAYAESVREHVSRKKERAAA